MTTRTPFKFYTWIHAGLSDSWRSVQASHCTAEMVRRDNSLVKEWFERDKTIVHLRAKNTEDLEHMYLKLLTVFCGSKIPVASFNEDEKTLGGLKTACGVILPAYCSDRDFDITEAAYQLFSVYGVGKQQNSVIEFLELLREARTL